MAYVMLPNLQIILFFICSIVKSFKKIFVRRLAIGSIVVYCTTIILNTTNKLVYCMELWVVKGWST